MHAQTHVWHMNKANFTSSGTVWWMYRPGTVWLRVQTWYGVVGCTDLVQCGCVYRPGTVWLDVRTWYGVVGCTDLVQCGWMYSSGTVWLHVRTWYSVVGYDVMMNQFLSNPN